MERDTVSNLAKDYRKVLVSQELAVFVFVASQTISGGTGVVLCGLPAAYSSLIVEISSFCKLSEHSHRLIAQLELNEALHTRPSLQREPEYRDPHPSRA